MSLFAAGNMYAGNYSTSTTKPASTTVSAPKPKTITSTPDVTRTTSSPALGIFGSTATSGSSGGSSHLNPGIKSMAVGAKPMAVGAKPLPAGVNPYSHPSTWASQQAASGLPSLQSLSSAFSSIGANLGGGAGAGGGGAGAMPSLVNTAQPSANAQWLVDKTKERYGDDSTKQLMDRFASEQRDVGSGLLDEAKVDAARRGIGDTGASALVRGKILAGTASNIAKGQRDIGLAQQARKDALLNTAANTMMKPEEMALAQQGLGLQQANFQQNAEQMRQNAQIAQAQLAMQQQQALLSAYSSMFGMV